MEVKDLYQQAKALGVCTMFAGNESKEELLRLFITPQGLEFCKKTGFPSLSIIRRFKCREAEIAGIYIDAGAITLHGDRKVVLVGDTHATLIYDDDAEYRHEVIVMHGAKADITASAWAVVFVDNIGGKITSTINDNAIVQ